MISLINSVCANAVKQQASRLKKSHEKFSLPKECQSYYLDKMARVHGHHNWKSFLKPAKQGVGQYCVKEMIGANIRAGKVTRDMSSAYMVMTRRISEVFNVSIFDAAKISCFLNSHDEHLHYLILSMSDILFSDLNIDDEFDEMRKNGNVVGVNPGISFISGRIGSGKSILMHSILNSIPENKKVLIAGVDFAEARLRGNVEFRDCIDSYKFGAPEAKMENELKEVIGSNHDVIFFDFPSVYLDRYPGLIEGISDGVKQGKAFVFVTQEDVDCLDGGLMSQKQIQSDLQSSMSIGWNNNELSLSVVYRSNQDASIKKCSESFVKIINNRN